MCGNEHVEQLKTSLEKVPYPVCLFVDQLIFGLEKVPFPFCFVRVNEDDLSSELCAAMSMLNS